MAIEKEKFFETINEVSKSEGLNGDNLLERIKDELYEIEKKLPEEDHGEYSKFKNDLWKDHLFSVKTSEEIVEDWKLLHLAAACNNLLTVELLLEKKVSVNARVKDGSKNDGLTALHIAASYGHENMIELLLSDNRVDPSLKSKNRTPREMVGNVPSRDTIIKMLEAAEESYSTKPKEKAKDLKIKIKGGDHYHLLQDSHRIPAKTVKKRSNVAAALENGNKRTSLNSTDESSDSTKTNEMSLEKVGKRQFSSKVAYASLAAMLVVGAALSIASGLSALLIVAASVVSALIAGGVTYTMSTKPTTELKEVDIQGSVQHGICKT
ncbi:hypothetical protein EUZ93_04645 [Wolbachia pipientis]|nr:hypothetical protein [Wolbachia pipientis]